MKSIAAVQVEFGAANMWETLRHCFPKTSEKTWGKMGIPIRLGFIFVCAKYGRGYEGVDGFVTFDHPVFWKLLIWSFAHCKVQTTYYSCMKNWRRKRERTIGPNRWDEKCTKLDVIDSKRVMHERLRWCANSDRMSKGLTAGDERDPEETK